MRIKTAILCILGVFLLGTVVNANVDIHAGIKVVGDKAHQAYDAVLDKASELTEKLKNVGHHGDDRAYQAYKNRDNERADWQAEVYARSNDPYNVNVVGGNQFRDALHSLYHNSTGTWQEWKDSLGDHWESFRESLKDKADSATDKIEDSFESTTADFRKFVDHFEDKGKEYTHDANKKVHGLLGDLKEKYEDFKSATKAKVEHWKLKATDQAGDAADVTEDKLNEAYHAAKRKYHESKLNFHDGAQAALQDAHKAKQNLEKTGSSIGDRASDAYDSLKDRVRELKDDASSTWQDWKSRWSYKWQERKETANDKAHETFEETIKDFEGYLKAFDEAAENQSKGVKGRLSRLFTNVKCGYEDLKERTKRRFESWGSDQPEDSATLEGYEQAKTKYTQSKAKLQQELDYLTGKSTPEDYLASMKGKIQDLYTDAQTTVYTWKDALGDKWTQFTGGDQGDLTTKPEDFQNTINDFLSYQVIFDETSKQATFTEEARAKLNDLLDSLGETYHNFKQAATKRWFHWSSYQEDEKSKALQVYDESRTQYDAIKQRLQDEFDFLAGKLDEANYSSRVEEYEKSYFARVGDKVKNAWNTGKEAVKDKVNQVLGREGQSNEL